MVPPQRLRRLKLSVVALGLCLVGLAWLFSQGPVAGDPAYRRAAKTIPLTDVSPWGANFFLHLEPDDWNQRHTVEAARAAGIRWAKQHIPWYDVQGQDGEFQWSKFDRIVDILVENDMEIIARLDFPGAWEPAAAWVPAEKQGPPNNSPPADPERYGAYVAATVRHFKGRVRFFQIWNEPNLLAEWGFNPEHPVDPAEYVDLLAAAAKAAREADPDVVILSAPLAINNETVDLMGNMSDLAYLERLYEAGAAEHFDVLSVNAFGLNQSPDEDPATDRLNFRRVELQRKVMERAGDDCKAVWANEYGWNAAPEGLSSIWSSVTSEEQARWTVDGVRYADRNWPWAGVFSIWFFRHCCQDSRDPVSFFAMMDEDFNPRRIYDAVMQAAAAPQIAGPGVWGERSAPVRLGRQRDWDWRWEGSPEERQRGCGGAFLGETSHALDRRYIESDLPSAGLKLDFQGTAAAIRIRRGPGAGTLEWRIDGAGDFRREVLQGDAGWDWLDLAESLGPGLHELELRLGPAGGSLAIDAFRVDIDPKADRSRPWKLTLGLAALALLMGILIDGRSLARRLDIDAA
jgi:hypothetical protein